MPQKTTQTIDWFLYVLVLLIILLGILAIYSVSYKSGGQFFWDQIVFAGIGIGLMILLTFVDYRVFKSVDFYLYIGGIILLVIVYFWGKVSGGATRWLDFKIFQLQPSEIFKFILIITLASYLSKTMHEFRFKNFIWVILIIALPIFLVLIQPDFGTAFILLVIGIGMLIIAKINKIYLFILGLITIIFVPFSWWVILKDYQKDRLLTFINPKADPFGAGYNVLQSTIAVGSGMFKGRGFGQGLQTQLNFLPAAHTDFIFAVIAEQLGFIGVGLIIILFTILLFKILKVAKIAADDFGYLIAMGIAILILFQVFVNIGMNIGIMPVTGIPLPFISAGGTSLIVNLSLIGILQSIIIRHKKLVF